MSILNAKYLNIIALSAFVAACGDTPPAPGEKTESKTASSPAEDTSTDTLKLPRSYIDSRLLLRGHFVDQEGAPTGRSLRSRLVRFKKHGNSLLMTEESEGLVVTDKMPSEIVLARFPIEAQDDNSVTINWHAGMLLQYSGGDWFGSDFASSGETLTHPFVPSVAGYVKNVKVDGEGRNFSHVLQMAGADAASGQPAMRPAEFRYRLEPYKPAPGFESYVQPEQNRFKRFGYFENFPRLELKSGREVLRATKWRVGDKPVLFHVSANTPPEYREAMKNGVLYWNRAFGREVFKVEMAPEGVSAPTFGYNMLQWVEWDAAGFAYADANSDPLTGEILQGNMYITSVFATGTFEEGELRLRKAESKTAKKAAHVHNGLCRLETKRGFAERVAAAKAAGQKDLVLRMVQDEVMVTVFHEVGHTLGLRHNFAGSLAATVNDDEHAKLVLDYLRNPNAPLPSTLEVTSSIMDYNTYEDDFLTANRLRTDDNYLPGYDRLAMQNLYVKRVADDVKTPAFCTDSHAGVFADCERFDTGNMPVARALKLMTDAMDDMPRAIVDSFYRAKNPLDKRDAKTVDDHRIEWSKLVGRRDSFVTGLGRVLTALRNDVRFVAVEQKLSNGANAGEDNDDLIQEHVSAQLEASGKRGRSLDKALQAVLNVSDETQINVAVARINGLLDSELYRDAFDAREKALITERATTFLSEFADNALMNEYTTLFQMDFSLLRYGRSAELFEDALGSLATRVVTERWTEDKVGMSYKDRPVQAANYKYGSGVRAKAALALSLRKSPSLDWQWKASAEVRKQIVAALEVAGKSMQLDPIEGKPVKVTMPGVLEAIQADLSKPLYRWLQQELLVLRSLSVPATPPVPMPGAPR